MKKNIILFYVIFIGLFLNLRAQIVTIPDLNFKNKLISLGIDSNQDGEIQVLEAESVTYLDVNNIGIHSLQGIESFKNLHYLECSDNLISNLDVSNLKDLGYLGCSFNQINNLNVNGLTQLITLVCMGNMMTQLDLNSLTNLQLLNCSVNFFLTDIYIKNGSTEATVMFDYTQSLKYICADSGQIASLQQIADSLNMTNLVIDNLCAATALNANTQFITLKIFPNPATDILIIETEKELELVLFNFMGEVIKTLNVKGREKMDISTLAEGIYWIKDTKTNFQQSFVKTK